MRARRMGGAKRYPSCQPHRMNGTATTFSIAMGFASLYCELIGNGISWNDKLIHVKKHEGTVHTLRLDNGRSASFDRNFIRNDVFLHKGEAPSIL
jgi:hypothetical protein